MKGQTCGEVHCCQCGAIQGWCWSDLAVAEEMQTGTRGGRQEHVVNDGRQGASSE